MKHYLLLFFISIQFIIFAQESKPVYQITASDGHFDHKVDLKWSAVPGADYYQIKRIYSVPKITKRGKEIPLNPDIIADNYKGTSFSDTRISFGQHTYIVEAFQVVVSNNQTNHKIITSLSDKGHRKVSDAEFFLEFQKSIDSSLPRIRTMKMLNFFGEKKKGHQNGHLVYKTTGIIKKPFRVMIDYKDFTDHTLLLNGTYEVQIYKLLSQEGKLVGTFYVDGIYKGTVTHNLIIKGGKSVGGFYEVQQDGRKAVSIPWDITEHPLDDSQYEDALKNSLKEAGQS